jgi:hypothetical protein
MSQASYRSVLRAPVRGLWSGVFDIGQFLDSFQRAISYGLDRAWTEGAATVGIRKDERTMDDEIALGLAIAGERARIGGLSQFILDNRRELQEPGKIRIALTRVYQRLELWVNRWLDVFNQAVLSAREDPKLKWIYNPLKDHCPTCSKLNGKVKRKSVWEAAGLRPQNPPNPKLACGGWNCGCQLVPTTEPATPGRLPGA